MAYLLIALLALGGCAYAIARSKAKAGLLSVYLVAFTLVAVAEWCVHSIFGLYRYHTGFSTYWGHDTAWGVLLGEFIFLPALNVVLAACANLWTWTVIGTALVTALEIIFVPLGFFIYRGWRLWLTIVTFPFYFLALGLYWRQVRRRGMTDPLVQAVTRLCAVVDMVTLMSLTFYASGVTDTSVRLVANEEGNRSLMRMMVHGTGMLLGQWALFPKRWSDRWGRIALTILGMIVVNDAFEGLGLLVFLRPLSRVLDAGGIGVITILAGVITDWLFGLAPERRRRRVPAWEPPET